MSMKTWIVGKHPSILDWPEGFFKGKNSIGLNSAGYLFEVDRVMTGHEDNIRGYKLKKIPRLNWILVRPMFDMGGRSIVSSGHYINWNRHPKPHRHEDLSPGEIKVFLERALNAHKSGTKTPGFPNFWTVLHLAIFFSIMEGATEIHLAGCNNEPGVKLDSSGPFLHAEYANRHTVMMMEEAAKLGVTIHRHMSYGEFLKNELPL